MAHSWRGQLGGREKASVCVRVPVCVCMHVCVYVTAGGGGYVFDRGVVEECLCILNSTTSVQ